MAGHPYEKHEDEEMLCWLLKMKIATPDNEGTWTKAVNQGICRGRYIAGNGIHKRTCYEATYIIVHIRIH
jgi:hypothetical protein